MALARKSFFARNWLPDSARIFLGRRFAELIGLAITATAGTMAISLATWSSLDPSWNHATSQPPANWLGWPGAYTADILIQTLGLGALALILPIAVWGWRLMTHRELFNFAWRIGAWPLACLATAALAAAIPAPQSWPLLTSLGGLMGDAVYGGFKTIFSAVGLPAPAIGAAFISLLIGIGTLIYATYLRIETVANVTSYLGFALREGFEGLRDEFEHWRWRILNLWGRLRIPGMPEWVSYLFHRPPSFDDTQGSKPTQRRHLRSSKPVRTARPKIKNRVSRHRRSPKASKRAAREAQPTLDLIPTKDYTLPPLNLLAKPRATPGDRMLTDDALEQNARLLESVLEDFGIRGNIIKVRPGPVVTLYELEPAPGIKSSRVIGLSDDIARSMSAVSARVAVVPGRNAIGIELPNIRREMVYLRELLSSEEYEKTSGKLTITLGKTIGGEPVVADLARMPHLLIAGTTGSGKSVGLNTMILSLLYRLSPDQCKLILIDPKMLELSVYEGIPHLLTPVVTEPKKAVVALKWAVREMEERYRKMSKLGVRNIEGFNARVLEADTNGETLTRTVHTGYDGETGEPLYEEEELPLEPLPLVVVIIDEMADLMMVAGKDIEAAVQRLAQMARAAGVHLIMATQRPSVDVITGTIKANFPTRVSFQVTSKIDSRTILGEQGAEQLLGQGDMLFMSGAGRLQRVHGPFVADDEVERVVKFLKRQGAPEYIDDVTAEVEDEKGDPLGLFGGNTDGGDELYDKAVAIVAGDRRASTSYIQRRLQIGYNRAARIMERMEEEGVVTPANHAGKREVLVGN